MVHYVRPMLQMLRAFYQLILQAGDCLVIDIAIISLAQKSVARGGVARVKILIDALPLALVLI